MIPYPICIRIKETGLFCSPNFFLFAWLCICWFFLHPYTSRFAFAISEQIRVVRLIQKYISITSIFILLHIIKYISKYFSKFCGKLGFISQISLWNFCAFGDVSSPFFKARYYGSNLNLYVTFSLPDFCRTGTDFLSRIFCNCSFLTPDSV